MILCAVQRACRSTVEVKLASNIQTVLHNLPYDVKLLIVFASYLLNLLSCYIIRIY